MDAKYIVMKDQLRALLGTNVVEVEFTKKDGTIRNMICTLDPDRVPNSTKKEPHGHHFVSEEVLPVWDLQKKGWRSFRVDSVSKYLARRAKASW